LASAIRDEEEEVREAVHLFAQGEESVGGEFVEMVEVVGKSFGGLG
jgi:hypothetical protein